MKQYRNSELLKGIANVARELRQEKKDDLSQGEVMDEIKIKTNISVHIGRIETAVTNISVSNLSLLCDYYKISISNFMARVEADIKKSKAKKKNKI